MARTIKMDLCIVMDTTGSMRSWLNEAKHRIGALMVDIPKTIKEIKGKDVALRVAFIGYKDHPERPVVHDFASDFASLERSLGEVRAEGGGDIPEDVYGALKAAHGLTWAQAGHKILVHVLEAPPHGSEFHDLSRDEDERFDVSTPLLDIIRSFAADNIYYVMLRCGSLESIHSTSKFASLCDLKYSEEANRMRDSGVAGKLPFFKGVELVDSENIVKQFLPLMIRTTTGVVVDKPHTIAPGKSPEPSAPSAPTIRQVLPKRNKRRIHTACASLRHENNRRGALMSQVAHKIEPSNHRLYPNKFFTVCNHTPDPACLLVYPTVHKFRTRPSHFSLRAGTDGFEVAMDTVQVAGPHPHPHLHRAASRQPLRTSLSLS